MIKSRPLSISPRAYTHDIKISIFRAHKYFRIVKQFNEHENTSKTTVNLLFKKLTKSKTLRSLKLKTESDSNGNIRLGMVKKILKTHSQQIQGFDISALFCPGLYGAKQMLSTLKRVENVCIPYDELYLKDLHGLRKVEKLFINITTSKVKTESVGAVLIKLTSLSHFCVSTIPSCLDKLLSTLHIFQDKYQRPVKFQITMKEPDQDFDQPELSFLVVQNIKKLSLNYLSSSSVFQKLVYECDLLNLRSLKLGFSVPELEIISYLKYFKNIPHLKKLSLSFTECWDPKFAEGFMGEIQLPPLLQDLKLTLPLSFNNLIIKYANNIKSKQGMYSWRKYNFFEEEPLFLSFFQVLQEAQHLRKAKFNFQIIETFNSYYSNFFVSIANRLPNLNSLTIHASDYTLQKDFSHENSQPFDLAIFFEACSKMRNLEHLEVLMPNLMFEDAVIDSKMTGLKSFMIGITETEDEEEKDIHRYNNVSTQVTGWLKRFLRRAPNLRNLVLDFIEVMDEPAFLKRFAVIERFYHLEAFCSKLIVNKCSIDTSNKVGKVLQSLKRLNTIVLNFIESDRNLLEIRKLLRYNKQLRDVLLTFDKSSWIGKENDQDEDEEAELSDFERQDEEYDSFLVSILDDEDLINQPDEIRL